MSSERFRSKLETESVSVPVVQEGRIMSKKVTYKGANADVQWDGRLCIHIGECGRAKNELFVGGRDPWCQPDSVSSDEVAEVVNRVLRVHGRRRLAEIPLMRNIDDLVDE